MCNYEYEYFVSAAQVSVLDQFVLGSTLCEEHRNLASSPSVHPGRYQRVATRLRSSMLPSQSLQNLYNIMDGVLPLALAVTIIRTIDETGYQYRVVEQGSVDHALRRQKHDAKPSYDQAGSALSTS